MGNERSGRGGIDWPLFRRAERMMAGGIAAHEVARELGIDRKTAHKIEAGEHVFQTDPTKYVQCPLCGHVVDELPCMFCSLAPLEIEPIKLDPADLVDTDLFAREETAAELYPQLVASIGQMGLIQWPLVVESGERRAEGGGPEYRVILGGRRVRAAAEAGLPAIWCGLVRANVHRQWDALVAEECLRVERDPIERGGMFAAALADDGCRHTQKTLGERIGRSQSYVAAHVNLLKLPDYWRDLISRRLLTVEHGRLLAPHADNPRLLSEVWRDLDTDEPPNKRQFRAMIEAIAERLGDQEPRRDGEEAEGDGSPLDEIVRPRKPKKVLATREVKLRFAEEAAENLLLRLDVIGEAEGCESREETIVRLVDFYWEHRPDSPPPAALGLRAA